MRKLRKSVSVILSVAMLAALGGCSSGNPAPAGSEAHPQSPHPRWHKQTDPLSLSLRLKPAPPCVCASPPGAPHEAPASDPYLPLRTDKLHRCAF